VEAVGNLKFDIPAGSTSALVQQLRHAATGPVIVCGSTVAGEEPIVLDALRAVQRRFPGTLLILAPRHPERFGAVAGLLASSGMSFWRRSQWDGGPFHQGGVFLLDTIGELADLYQLANVAFIGGSLVPRGGHNILEAARFGVPIVVGPYTENFRDIVNSFLLAHAIRIANAAEFGSTIDGLLADPGACRSLGDRARETWQVNAGATARTLARIETLMPRPLSSAALSQKENA
jgi:3-deoxy-D-manno-octulosonic-acid transferase